MKKEPKIHKKALPSISVVIPAYNEEKNLKRLFFSLKKQDYPQNKIEYLFIDDDSVDGSLKLAREFGCRLLRVKTHDIELNKGIGLHQAINDLVYFLDADMEICNRDFFSRLAKPLLNDLNLGGSFTAEFSLEGCGKKIESSLLRFISYDPLQQDPLYAFFSPTIRKQIIKKTKDYFICKFIPGKIPAVGRILYRRKELLKTSVGESKPFIDLEAVEIYTRKAYNLYAFVPKAKIRHYHAATLSELIKKRLRNLERDYLPNFEHKYFLWFNPKNKKDILKIFLWIFYANLFFPELIRGILKMIYYQDIAFLWHPVVSITTTDAIVWGIISKPKGRKLIFEIMNNFFRKHE